MPDTLPDLSREDYLAMLRSPDSPATLEWKISPTGIIDDDDDGLITAIVAVTGIVDEVNDIILPGAFDTTLRRRTPKGVWSHDVHTWVSRTEAIGELQPGDPRLPTDWKGKPWPAEAGALVARTRFNLGTRDGRDAYSNVKFFDAGPLGPQVEWCADAETEILTGRGWKRYDEVMEGDEAYVLDPVTLTARFERIEAMNVWPRKVRRMRLIETGGHSSLTTGAHRWPTAAVRDGHGTVQWRRTDNLDYRHRLFRTAPHVDAPSEAKFSDEFVELVAWFWTEGWVNGDHGRFAHIGQSSVANPTHCAAIRRSLAAFPGQVSERRRKGGMIDWRLKRDLTDTLLAFTGEAKEPRPEFLRALTFAQLHLLIDRCLDGDGHRTDAGQRTFYQVAEAGVRAFEMACALAGIPTNTHPTQDYGNRHGRPPQVVSLLRNGVSKPLDAVRVSADYTADKPKRTRATDEWVEHDGIVWCPTTPSGTWLARRRGTVYFTGNSIGYNSLPGYTRRNKAGQRELAAIDLYEYGPVLFGAMPLAGTVGTKARIDALEHKGGPFMGGTVLGDLELKVAGKEASPKDVKNTQRLKEYWERGEGAAKIRWGEPGDFDRCVRELGKYLPPGQVKGYCANRHKGATGGWPGHAPGVEQAEAAAKKAEHKASDLLDQLDGKADKRTGSMPDGSFPITDGTSLKKAIKAHARAKDPEKAKRHIKRRAKAIGCEHMIPDQWGGTKDAALLDDTDVDDGGLVEAVAALEAFEALGMTDDEIDAALADRGDEWTALPDLADQGGPEGGGDEPDDGTDDDPAAGGEHKASRTVGDLEVGDVVLELKSVDGAAFAGKVRATSTRGTLMGVALDTKSGMRTVWVPREDVCQVRQDPYAEVKDGLRLVLERKDYPFLPGSVEARQQDLRAAINDLLLPEPDENGLRHAYVSLDATFADYVVATLNDYSMPGPDNEHSFAVPYTVAGDGDGTIELGQPIPVERQVVLVPADADDAPAPVTPATGGMNPALTLARKIATQAKALLDDLEAKASTGEDLSGTHVRRIRAASEQLDGAIAGLGGTLAAPGESKALLGEAAQLLARSALL